MGFIRSAKSSLPASIPTPEIGVSEETLEILGKPQPVVTQTTSVITKVELPDVPAGFSFVVDNQINASTIFNVMNENELKRENKNLYELYTIGYITEHEYEVRKSHLENLTEKLKKGKKSKKSQKSQGSSSSSKKRRERNIRVFLSSTFRDMQRERDELIKYIFPTLKQECSERGIFFTEVDLRWGITVDQAERGEVLGLCLQEIDKCRPYFINILGNRYGFVPKQIPANLLTKYPFLPDTNKEINERSVTEYEVIHGALNNIQHATRAHFYFKNFDATEVPDNPEKMAALKSRISKSGLPVRNYNSIQQLGDMVLRDLKADIDSDFPAGEDPDPFEIENNSHEIYAEIRAKVYVGKSQYFNKIDRYLDEVGAAPLVIIGESGAGKSSFLANWTIGHRSDPSNDNDVVLLHFVGTSPASADHFNLIRRVMKTIQIEFGVQETIPVDNQTLVKNFSQWLGMIPDGRRLILIMDALNQMDDFEGGKSLYWLPSTFPERVKLIVSTIENSEVFNILVNKRNFERMRIEPLDKEEKEQLAVEYLGLFGKNLDHTQLQRICTAPQTKNPLFLRVLLEELRLHGVFEEISMKIEFYLEAQTVSDLYEKILSRMERDFPAKIVSETMAFIWVSRRGLSEIEILEITGTTRLEFSPFFLAIQESLVSRNGLLNFFHDYLRQAVEKRYLQSDDKKIQYMSRLANYFMTCRDIARKSDELPYLLHRSGDLSRLKDCLCDIDIFTKLYNKSRKYELKGYWLSLKMYDVVTSYTTSLRNYEVKMNPTNEQLARLLPKIARFLREMVKYDGAFPILQRAADLCKKIYGEEHLSTAKVYYLLAELYWNQSKWVEAEPFCTKALSIREKILGADHPDVAMALMGIGEMEMRKPGNGDAKRIIERALKIRVNKFGSDHPLVARCLQDLAIIADTSGNSELAVQLCSQALRIREKHLGPSHPHTATSLETLGSIHKLRGEPHIAEPMMRRAIEINLTVHGEMHPSTVSCLEWEALILRDLNRIDEALECEVRAKKIQEVLGEVGERIAD